MKGQRYGPEDEQLLNDEIQKRVGDFLDYSINYVDEIGKTKSGKLRFVISHLPKTQLPNTQLPKTQFPKTQFPKT